MHEAFQAPEDVLEATEAVTAVLINARRLYVAYGSGLLASYLLPSDAGSPVTPENQSVPLNKKPIEQLGFIKELNALVALSDGHVTLIDSLTLKTQTSLQQTKQQANLFAVDSSVQSLASSRLNAALPGIPVVCTTLVVACRRRLILFAWQDSQWVEPQEVALPHQVRSLAFTASSTIILGYSDNTYGKLIAPRPGTTAPLQLDEFPLPGHLNGSVVQSGAPTERSALNTMGLGKLGGYMGIGGLGRVARNQVLSTSRGEVLVMREATAILIDSSGSTGKSRSIDYVSEPTEITVCAPYVIALLSHAKHSTLAVHSLTSLNLIQEIDLTKDDPQVAPSHLTPSFGAKAPLVYVSNGASETPRVHIMRMPSWAHQLDQMVQNGSYEDALPLLETVEDILLPDKAQRRVQLQALNALARFFRGEFDAAIDVFIELDLNPAKVICLYPERISGKLYKDEYHREEQFNGRRYEQFHQEEDAETPELAKDAAPSSPAPTPRKWTAVMTPYRKSVREDDATSIHTTSSHSRQPSIREPLKSHLPDEEAEFKRSVEVLLRYLADRRQQVNKALSALRPGIRPTPSSYVDPGTVNEIMDIPDGPLSKLKPLQLHRVAQVVDTALFRCYLAIRPTLLGPLCRLDNWCVVEEVEALLKEANKYRELLDLYRGRKNHSKSLELLKTISEDEGTPEEKVASTVDYLQRLGPAHLELIFSAAEWVFQTHRPSGLRIFTADLEEVENLPRHAVSMYLEKIGPDVSQAYLEHIVDSLGEDGPEFHEKLIEMYLKQVKGSKDEEERSEVYAKLLRFLQNSTQYRADRILGRLPSNDLFEARASLLGRLGQHQAALLIYVTRLRDFQTAEEYCKRVYATLPSDQGSIFLTLLKIYLKPQEQQEPLLGPALQLLSRHGTRINADNALALLPPLITVQDLHRFLHDTITHQAESRHSGLLQREVYRAQLDQLQETAVELRSQYVKVTDSRTCPLCHKRIGNSVIAVHLPDGKVTHYRCRTRFEEL